MVCFCCGWFSSRRAKSNSSDVEAACSLERHNLEIHENRRSWENKPALRKIYKGFHSEILRSLRRDIDGPTVELGSGLGQIKEVIPDCITTDVLPNPWLDQIENAYGLSFHDNSVANLILFDVWHHLRFPGTALMELRRVLTPGGRLIIFDPCMSLLGLLVYGLFHHEPLGLRERIEWFAPEGRVAAEADYYAAAGNAWRIFRGRDRGRLSGWCPAEVRRFAALSYVACGGFRGPQLYPSMLLPLLQRLDAVLDHLPALFATRLLVILEKS
jgi:SAM-dependent methyltransferase